MQHNIVKVGTKFKVVFIDGSELGPFASYLTAEIEANAESQRRSLSALAYPSIQGSLTGCPW